MKSKFAKLPTFVFVVSVIFAACSPSLVEPLSEPKQGAIAVASIETTEGYAKPAQTDAEISPVNYVKDFLGQTDDTDAKAAPSKRPPSPEPLPKTVKMTFVGDLMVHEWQFRDAYDSESDTYDFNHCFEKVKPYLSEPHYTVGNLETTFAGKEAGYAWYPTFNAPDSFAEALKNAGFDFLTTANNHSNDKRTNGILRTIDVLDEIGIEHTGTFKSQEQRDKIFIKDINSMRFAFLSYSYGTNGIPLSDPYLLNLLDDELIYSDIQKAKELEPDFIIVMPHMGNEYEQYVRDGFKNTIEKMFEAGADIVIASHPHVLQPMEFIKDDNGARFTAYSMGNFISSQRTVPRDAGVILNIEFERKYGKEADIKKVSVIPTWVQFVNAKGQQDIKVLSVYDALTMHKNGENTDLRPQDIDRLKQVHNETSKILLGETIPLEDIRNEYEIIAISAPESE